MKQLKLVLSSYKLISAQFVSLFIASIFFLISNAGSAIAQDAPEIVHLTNFVVEEVVTGLELPTSFDFAPDGRIFISEKSGLVHVFDEGQLYTFADIRNRVNTVGDRGLMSVAIHPDFPKTPYVYLAYVYEPPEAYSYNDFGARASQVIRVEARVQNLNAAVPGSGIVILGSNSTFEHLGNPGATKAPPLSCLDSARKPVPDCLPNEDLSHLIDFLRFGPDGALYVSNGDGHTDLDVAIRAQDVDSLAGKILRINPITGAGYPDNPFSDGDLNSNRSKVYAFGLRNPFRFTFHPVTGEIYVGEVGNDTWEEISRGGPGANFGWPCYEGPDPAGAHLLTCLDLYKDESAVVPSLYAYEHMDGTGAVIGGDFYTGDSYPDEFRGAYFFAEFSFTSIRPLKIDDDATLINDGFFIYNLQGPVQISAGPDGDLYILSIVNGALYRVRYSESGNQLPIAAAQATPMSGLEPLTVQFSSAGTNDPGGEIDKLVWDFGDNTSSTEPNPEHVYYLEGVYDVTLKVTDNSGTTDTDRLQIRVGNSAPTARILGPPEDVLYRVGDVVKLRGQGTDVEDGTLTTERFPDGMVTETVYTSTVVTNSVTLASGETQILTRTIQSGKSVTREAERPALEWTALLHHHTHVHYDHFQGNGPEAEFTYPDHGDNSYLEVCLTATDSGGLQDKSCMDLLPREVNYTFKSVPAGLTVLYNGTNYTTPFNITTYVNAKRQLGLFDYSSSDLYFSQWSHGAAADHKITIGPVDRTITVTYTSPVLEAAIDDELVALVDEDIVEEVVETSATVSTIITDVVAESESSVEQVLVSDISSDIASSQPVDATIDNALVVLVDENIVEEVVETSATVSTTITDVVAESESSVEQVLVSDISSEIVSSQPVDATVDNTVDNTVPIEDPANVFNTVIIDERDPIASPSFRGQILREWWSEVSGSEVSDLTSYPGYPNQPTGEEYLTLFEAPKSIADAYGARIRGYLHPPVTGYYRLWIACDDTGELFLSTDESATNATLRASCSDWTHSREWLLRPEQGTGEVFLEAGQPYYIEALHKEGGLKDNLSVAWQIPEQTKIIVIDGAYLSPVR